MQYNFSNGLSATSLLTVANQFRHVYKSDTFYLDAPSTADQGQVTTAQFVPVSDVVYKSTADVVYLDLNPLPWSDDSVLMLSTKAQQRPAREGAFLVYGFDQPSPQYQYTTNYNLTISTPTSDVATGTVVTRFGHMKSGVIHFSGLSPSATVRVKTLFGLEVLPQTDGVWMPFTSAGAMLEEKALDRYYRLMYKLPDSLPASANDLGSIWAAAKKFAPKLLDALDSDIVGALPGVGGVLRAGGKAGKALIPIVQRGLQEAQPHLKDVGQELQKAAPRLKTNRKKKSPAGGKKQQPAKPGG